MNNGLSIIKEDLIAKEIEIIIELRDRILKMSQHQPLNQEKESNSLFKCIISLRRKVWRLALIVPKFIDYINEPNKAVNLMEGFYLSAITYQDVVGWSNLNLVIFEGWLPMLRYLTNNNPNCVALLFQKLESFFINLISFFNFLKITYTSYNKDCFFKLITCIQVRLKKIYNNCIEKSNVKSELILLKNYLSIMEAISKLIKKNFTIDDILKKLHDLSMISSSIVMK